MPSELGGSGAVNAERLARIRARLEEALHTMQIEVIDDSHLHVGHAGARDGRGHFRVRIVAAAFDGLNVVRRHQLVYRALGELMQTDIHALGVSAFTPEEAAQKRGVGRSSNEEDSP
ncbi:MAG TPA: BolA family protein [Steroidobacter sp.]|jgi:BolA protein|nr:BolA family protein [Steroidobacteraceae bacterium]HLS80604.1 BolA family protein [Steroidobacter sp.]